MTKMNGTCFKRKEIMNSENKERVRKEGKCSEIPV
jgi:hypothetical protein